jgi:excisionase family DNA binding protein
VVRRRVIGEKNLTASSRAGIRGYYPVMQIYSVVGGWTPGKRVQYVVHMYGLRSRLDRLRARGLLTKKEIAGRLGIHESTLTRWVEHGIIKAHAYNGHAWLYEEPPTHPTKHCSRWDRLSDRATAIHASRRPEPRSSSSIEGGVV